MGFSGSHRVRCSGVNMQLWVFSLVTMCIAQSRAHKSTIRGCLITIIGKKTSPKCLHTWHMCTRMAHVSVMCKETKNDVTECPHTTRPSAGHIQWCSLHHVSHLRAWMKLFFMIMWLGYIDPYRGNVQFVRMPVQLLHVCSYFRAYTTLEEPDTHFPWRAGWGRPTAVAFFSLWQALRAHAQVKSWQTSGLKQALFGASGLVFFIPDMSCLA